MMHLQLSKGIEQRLKILCMGAHSDDIEIGCGGTILQLAKQYPNSEFYWTVFSATGVREAEARHAAQLFGGLNLKELSLKTFRDGFMPYDASDIKATFENELKYIQPDIIFTHNGNDAHQDHRAISQLTWNTFRNHLIFEYEIPKYDGDFGKPSVFVQLERNICETKINHLMRAFQSQQAKQWFEPETFFALMRLRGMECASSSGYAEAFYSRKLLL